MGTINNEITQTIATIAEPLSRLFFKIYRLVLSILVALSILSFFFLLHLRDTKKGVFLMHSYQSILARLKQVGVTDTFGTKKRSERTSKDFVSR